MKTQRYTTDARALLASLTDDQAMRLLAFVRALWGAASGRRRVSDRRLFTSRQLQAQKAWRAADKARTAAKA